MGICGICGKPERHRVIAADEDYSHLEFPWGSNPITNPMLSGADFEILTEGGALYKNGSRWLPQQHAGRGRELTCVLGRRHDRAQLRAVREMHPHKIKLYGRGQAAGLFRPAANPLGDCRAACKESHSTELPDRHLTDSD